MVGLANHTCHGISNDVQVIVELREILEQLFETFPVFDDPFELHEPNFSISSEPAGAFVRGRLAFIDSQSFGVFFMTVVGMAIKLYWGEIEKHLRSTAPYIAMASDRGATADHSVLVRMPSHPVVGLAYGSSWRQPLLGFVTVNAALSEVLVITLNTVPFSTSTAYVAFELSVYISAGILALMIAAVPLVIVWGLRRRRKAVGNPPGCIAQVLALVDDELRSSFGDLKELDSTQRDRVVQSWKCRYSLVGRGHGDRNIVARCSG
ncbi:hypothetical protein P171DRAFT_489038 [Karstenula rhodostoma CBS 690.94]|uniref:Uncharacterized protein n=1 Tax=Karstenula rhodostoma CBS 690.94 TaxID=1392251 RepID=A0A9P4U8R3_9PLEO|nr:hypothetical protein P171DRAFT_489038 [Karstenula rhodostoma CBS 690.94]